MQPEIASFAGTQALESASRLFDQGAELLRNRNIQPALRCFDSAQQLGYEANECAGARWSCWMFLGEFERAWRESDFISALGGDPNQFWDGRSWDGKRVILRCLHGLGDAIQFIRYAPLLKEKCRSLFVQTHPQLVNLMRGVRGIDRVFTWETDDREDFSSWDMQMEVTELPKAFRSSPASIPLTPYVQVPEERIRWASRWFDAANLPRIGVAWEAGPWDPARSISFSQFSSLFALDLCRFYGLQKGIDATSLRECGAVDNVECHATDICDTAALILNLDLVITVDTMTAHLAGALGRPVWMLLPARADWRWMLDRCDTPWYPSARLFRQRTAGDWRPVIEDVCVALRETVIAGAITGTRQKGMYVSQSSDPTHLPKRLVRRNTADSARR